MTALLSTIDNSASTNIGGSRGQATSAPDEAEPTLSSMTWLAGAGATPAAVLCVDHHADAEGEAADRRRAVRVVRNLCTGDRPDHRRLSHRELGLAVYLLRQPGARRADDRHAVVFARKQADEAFAAARGRLAGRHHHGDRSERAADRARGRQQGRLVRIDRKSVV